MIVIYAKAREPIDDIKSYRHEVFELNKDSRKAREFYNKMENSNNLPAILVAYKGVSAAHIAKYSSNPFEKWSMLHTANRLIEKAEKMDPNNIEIRFLRYAFQTQIPKILGMSDDIREDKKYIIDNYKRFDWYDIEKDICRYIFDFMISNGGCNDEEKRMLREYAINNF